MRNYSLSKLILIPLLLCIPFLASANNKYSDVFIFGDSLSDTGNLASVIGDFPAPYYQNRVTNGPVAVDTLTSKLGDTADASLYLLGLNAGHNYSVAGAKASGSEPIDLDTQILSFQANHGFVAPKRALYVIFIGGNDVRAALYEADPTASAAYIQTATDKVRAAINSLRQIGARSFLVVNVPNIGLIPETRLMAAYLNNPALINRAEELSKSYNNSLHDVIEGFEEHKKIRIHEFDLYSLFGKVVEEASRLGFTNNSEACFRSLSASFHPDCNYGANADQFIFFDEIHPTARVHKLFGEAFYEGLRHKNHDEDENEHEYGY